jgi:hypothetical protein
MPTLLLLALFSPAATYPADGGIVDVTKPPYNAKGDGVADDTAAIQKALDDHPNAGAIVFLPNGTYRVTDTLRWGKGPHGGMEYKRTSLEGQTRDKAILKVADGTPGFGDAAKPRAVLWTGSKPAQRFSNAVRSLTIDTGTNAGAIGAQFMANNQGTVRDVTIRGNGPIGLDLGYTDENGPLLVKNVSVTGFAVGINCRTAVDSLTMEDITLAKQTECGLRNAGQVLSVRNLTSDNAVPAVVNAKGPSFLTLIDAKLTGGAADKPAIVNEAPLFARNVTAAGYAKALENTGGEGKPHAGLVIDEFTHHPAVSLFPSAGKSLGLPVEDPPAIPEDDPAAWANVVTFGAGGNTYHKRDVKDDAPAFQKAIDSGATTVYVPRGFYVLHDTVRVRGKVRRVVFLGAQLVGGDRIGDKPAFKIEDGDAPAVAIERMNETYGSHAKTWIAHATARTLVLRNTICGRFEGTGGKVFIEDVCGGPFAFRKQAVWARQLNQETQGTHVTNDGGTLWVLGYKTERGGTLLETVNGGKTEVLGCFAYATTGVSKEPMFVVKDSAFAATMGEAAFGGNFPVLVRETRNGETKELGRKDAKSRYGIGALLPLYVSGK